ncbi:DUF1993 domain-containing protein [Chondromyces apiculatus]|uniref:DUF1993 domain-containing protein n=1 Tax=Chondromyces apiculatus DSM 436 TaxID=1192034 RepID=A0A017TF44_9BACT|nr:DUF1993 domain-containing protein [Chondromyces apiculatus]EYF07221.1 Hypothetical protein CAP_0700 [Chondromyces apiculatus DSM 436]
MSLSMYDVSIPIFIRAFENLSSILKKAEAHAVANNLDLASLTEARLTDDMLPFTAQVQIATDSAKGCAARLAGIEVPSFPDTEKTFPELQARIEKTLDFLRSIDAAKVKDSEAREITLTFPSGKMDFTGQSFLLTFALPNFFFHITTAYALLRQKGVPIGKMDFLGGR